LVDLSLLGFNFSLPSNANPRFNSFPILKWKCELYLNCQTQLKMGSPAFFHLPHLPAPARGSNTNRPRKNRRTTGIMILGKHFHASTPLGHSLFFDTKSPPNPGIFIKNVNAIGLSLTASAVQKITRSIQKAAVGKVRKNSLISRLGIYGNHVRRRLGNDTRILVLIPYH
jgi:hypothetical protein